MASSPLCVVCEERPAGLNDALPLADGKCCVICLENHVEPHVLEQVECGEVPGLGPARVELRSDFSDVAEWVAEALVRGFGETSPMQAALIAAHAARLLADKPEATKQDVFSVVASVDRALGLQLPPSAEPSETVTKAFTLSAAKRVQKAQDRFAKTS